MNKRIGLVIAGLGAAALMAGGSAYAASSSSSAATTTSSTTIYGCYDSGGNVKVLNGLGTTTCPKGYSALDWNQAGLAGAGATVTTITANPNNTNCPNGGAEFQDGNPADNAAYACNGAPGSQGPPGPAGTLVWTFTCQPSVCWDARAATVIPAGTVLTPVSINVTGDLSSCNGNDDMGAEGQASINDASGDQLAQVEWQAGGVNESQLGTSVTTTSAGPLTIFVSSSFDLCVDSTITFTFDEAQPYS